MSSAISLEFQYQPEDYIHPFRAHCARQLNLKLDIAVIIILGSIGLAGLWYLPTLDYLSLISLLISVSFSLMLIAAFTIVPVLIFRFEPKFRDQYFLTFSATGIHFRTAYIDSQLQWSLYTHVFIDLHSYMLYYGTRSFTIIPKRVFRSAQQQENFEQLLTEKMAKIIK